MVKFNLLRLLIVMIIVWLIFAMWVALNYEPTAAGKQITPTNKQTKLDLEPRLSLKPLVRPILEADLFGQTQQQKTTASASPQPTIAPEVWTRIAVVKERQGVYTLLRSPKGELKSFRAGDTLPNNEKLKNITAKEIVVLTPQGKTNTYRIMD